MSLKLEFANVLNSKRRSCPFCGATKFGRSRRKGLFERTILAVTSIRPYRCDRCERRFYCRPGRPLENRPAYQPQSAVSSAAAQKAPAGRPATEVPEPDIAEVIHR
jgi:hypothetical protein